ncbi:V-type ATP synthase subunit E [bacterium]|nr:V-type ATP synthase subunit E [bacterium]
MSLEKILEKIIQDSEEEIRKILDEAKSRASQIIEEGKREAEKVAGELTRGGEENARKVKEIIVTLASLESRKRILGEKQRILGELYLEVEKRIRNFNGRDYRELVKKIMLESCQTGEELVVIGENDRKRIDQKLIESVNAELVKAGKKGKLKLSPEPASIPDGFILKLGKIEINNSWENILRSLREKTEDEIIKLLFT